MPSAAGAVHELSTSLTTIQKYFEVMRVLSDHRIRGNGERRWNSIKNCMSGMLILNVMIMRRYKGYNCIRNKSTAMNCDDNNEEGLHK